MRMTRQAYEALQADIDQRRAVHRAGQNQPLQPPILGGEPSHEKDLHNQIIRYLNNERILFFHGSMAHKAMRTLGETDFIIALPSGVTLWLECKTKTGKLSPEQVIVRHRLLHAGHSYSIVRSYNDFLNALHTCLAPLKTKTSPESADAPIP